MILATKTLVINTLLNLTIIVTNHSARADTSTFLLSSLSAFTESTNSLKKLLDKTILDEKAKLARLEYLKETLISTSTNFRNAQTKLMKERSVDQEMISHPVHSFIVAHKFLKVSEELAGIHARDCHDDQRSESMESELDKITARYKLPNFTYTDKYGEAILRLQTFYGLDLDQLVRGKLVGGNKFTSEIISDDVGITADLGMQMGASECFELGKIAYAANDNHLAINWFKKALQLMNKSDTEIDLMRDDYDTAKTNLEKDEVLILGDILDYLAFAAYRDGQVNYAADITKRWLTLDPNHDRALENLEFYEDEITNLRTSNGQSNIDEEKAQSILELYAPGQEFPTSKHQRNQDVILRDLCTRTHTMYKLHCYTKLSLENYSSGPQIKIEILNKEPLIYRVHDIITDQEARHLRRKSIPRLTRSTVQSKSGVVKSDYRIARTAWLSSNGDPVVKRIDQRVKEVTNLELDESEELQVVNYSIGGYYGPHLDAYRPVYSDTKNSSSVRNDRLATFLIYLNKVFAGGSTVFPKLNLTVPPIENSAVIWYNIKTDTSVDDRTLHSGCPVLLGSKWIATKWPRERANSLKRPCNLLPES